MKSEISQKVQSQIAEIEKQLKGKPVSQKKVETIGKGLYELAKVFAEIDRENPA